MAMNEPPMYKTQKSLHDKSLHHDRSENNVDAQL